MAQAVSLPEPRRPRTTAKWVCCPPSMSGRKVRVLLMSTQTATGWPASRHAHSASMRAARCTLAR